MKVFRDVTAITKPLFFALIIASAHLVGAAPSPKVEIYAPEELAQTANRVRELAEEDFSEILNLTGRIGFSREIRVVLIPEGTPLAGETPSWVAGYARGDRSTVVLFPARVPSYPDRNLRALLRHEIAHLLVWEAAGGRSVPRWLDEGIATVAAREWGLEDRARYGAAVIGPGPRSTRQLDRSFAGSAVEVRRAYALSAGFVRFCQVEYGSLTSARILDGLAEGLNIEKAFRQAAGTDLRRAEKIFFRDQALWNTWLPFLTSTGALWMAVTLLALLAILRRLAKNRAMRKQWDSEEVDPSSTSDVN
ncbi:MAG: hypothetical protein K8R59_18165 [Thermoanaerobaculales bacterium]|nr:hypothetical protein [Thermoanaerobaculales bacterium]